MFFTEQDWQRLEQNWTLWWAGELERPLVMIENPVRNRRPEELTREFLLEKPIDAVLDYYQSRLENTRYYGDAWPKWQPYFGAGIMAGFLGARVHCDPDMATIWFEPPQPRSAKAHFDHQSAKARSDHWSAKARSDHRSAKARSDHRSVKACFDQEGDLADLHLSFKANNPWWQRVKELTQAGLARWGDRVTVAFTDLGGNLDILASLRTTQKLLFDLYDAPNQVAHLSRKITQLWLDYYDHLYTIVQNTGRGTTPWAAIWSPRRCYMFQSDFSYMISPEMFERFVLPDLATCCERVDHAFYHLDGKGQIRHLDMLLSLDSLFGIQWIPGDGQPPPEAWLPLLKRIRDAGKLCQLYVTPLGARTIVEALGGQGFAFYIMEPMSQNEAEDFLPTLTN